MAAVIEPHFVKISLVEYGEGGDALASTPELLTLLIRAISEPALGECYTHSARRHSWVEASVGP
jgi:hypothetical protein